MLLGEIVKPTRKDHRNIAIKDISFDSRITKRNDVFFAIDGTKTSGVKFIKEAIKKGAAAIVSTRRIKNINTNIPNIIVRNVREALSDACSKFYKDKPKNIIAVTGTNGKSSVAHFFYQILKFNKISCASIGTLGIISKKYKKKTNLTSMDPLLLHKNLQKLKRSKIDNVILEASSHGLHQRRLDNLNINTGIFTNLSHDHLDYHKNIKSYFNSKMHLFKNLLKKNSLIITDEDNKEFKNIEKIAKKRRLKKITIGSESGDIKVLNNKYKENKQIIRVLTDSKIYDLEIPLIGYFQIKNLLIAILAATNCGLSKEKIFRQISKIKPVPGRLESITNLKNNINIIIDFAHTPDALEQSLVAIKKQFKKEIVIVFGCGGERDKEKRFSMGKIANKYCKKIYVTDDNPRNENASKIRKSIIKGCKRNAKNIGNRKKAIQLAIKNLKQNQILLIAGKGHENIQDYGKKVINFSDKKIVKSIIKKENYSFTPYNNQSFLLGKVFNKNFKQINYSGVSINTKTLKKDNIFFAIRGKNIDGHKFVGQAMKKGAIRCVVSRKIKNLSEKKFIKVKNTLSSLNDLAKVTRDNTSAQIIGITGSVGKTTLKNLVAFTLKNYGKTYHSPLSYNNKYGVPLSVCNLKKNTDFGVFEAGMDKKGEIYNLSKIIKPEIAVITNVSGAHFKNFRSLNDIAAAKGEIIDNVVKGGHIILNKDDKFFSFFYKKAKKRNLNIISFSGKKKADIFLLGIKKEKSIYKIKVSIKEKIYYFYSRYSANNFINNVLACISILSTMNLDLNNIKKKFKNFPIPSGRGDVKVVRKYKKKFKFIDESYNANPLSMLSAIKNMNDYKRTNNSRKIIFLGDMLELGKKSRKLHKELSKIINKSDVDKVFVYGRYIKDTFNLISKRKKGKIFSNLKEASMYLSNIINNNDLLMIKGSNATGLNQFSKNIKKEQINAI